MERELENLKRVGRESECKVLRYKVFVAQFEFHDDNPTTYNSMFLLVSAMVLLLKYVYPMIRSKKREMGMVKFSLTYLVKKEKVSSSSL